MTNLMELSEPQRLSRLTPGEKERMAADAIAEFPHIDDATITSWARAYGIEDEVPEPITSPIRERAEALASALRERIEDPDDQSKKTMEALDHFIYGYVEPTMLRGWDIDPDELAERDPQPVWGDIYD